MVTHSVTMLEKHLVFTGETAPRNFSTNRVKKRSIKPEDPMSHRIIEKRRRDRMNNCLADLSRLIPPEYLKKGRGRIEKTEIIEMAIKHMRHLQNIIASSRFNENSDNSVPSPPATTTVSREPITFPGDQPIIIEHYRLGYLECLSEAMHFLVEVQGYIAGDSLCVQMINHLHKHCDKILKGNSFNFPKKHVEVSGSDSSASPANGTFNNSPPLGLSSSTGSASDDNQPLLNSEAGKPFESCPKSLPMGHRLAPYPKGGETPYQRFPEREGVENDNRSDSEMHPLKFKNNEMRKEESKNYLTNYETGGGFGPRNYPISNGIYAEESSNFENISLKEENGNGPSQLREMLTSPPTAQANGHVSRTISEAKGSSSPLSNISCCEFSPSHPSNVKSAPKGDSHPPDFAEAASDNHHMMYKFKNNIKQRFSKEKREHSECDVNGDSMKRQKPNEDHTKHSEPLMRVEVDDEKVFKFNPDLENRKKTRYLSESEVQDVDISNRLSFGHKSLEKGKKWEEAMVGFPCQNKLWGSSNITVPYFGAQIANGCRPSGIPSLSNSLNNISGASSDSGPGIPIFALHAKGSFYIPLTLDHSALSPFLTILGISKTDEGIEEKAVLHPVTISVNFQSHLVR